MIPRKLAKTNFGVFFPLKTDLSLHEYMSVSIPTLNPPLGPYKGDPQIPTALQSLCLGRRSLWQVLSVQGPVPFPRATWFLLAERRAHFWLVIGT